MNDNQAEEAPLPVIGQPKEVFAKKLKLMTSKGRTVFSEYICYIRQSLRTQKQEKYKAMRNVYRALAVELQCFAPSDLEAEGQLMATMHYSCGVSFHGKSFQSGDSQKVLLY